MAAAASRGQGLKPARRPRLHATLEQGLNGRKLGHLADPDLAAVRELLGKILVLER